MSGNDKQLRKQLRNVIQPLIPTLITNELVEALRKEVLEQNSAFMKAQETTLITRLDHIEKLVNASLKESDKRARAVQGFLVQGAVKEINEYLFNAHVSMVAWEEIMADKIGNTDEFNAAVDARKKTVAERITKEREEAMAKRIASQAAPAPEPTPEPTPEPAATEAPKPSESESV